MLCNRHTVATTQGRLSSPNGVFLQSNLLFAADGGNHRLMVFDVASITHSENAVNGAVQINASQAPVCTKNGPYFWSAPWQEAELEASEDIAQGRVRAFENPQALIAALDADGVHSLPTEQCNQLTPKWHWGVDCVRIEILCLPCEAVE
jgi:hypothetical protein